MNLTQKQLSEIVNRTVAEVLEADNRAPAVKDLTDEDLVQGFTELSGLSEKTARTVLDVPATNDVLVQVFQELGLSESAARTAARGRL